MVGARGKETAQLRSMETNVRPVQNDGELEETSERHRRMVRGTEKSPGVERPPGELEEGLGKETTPRKPRGAHGEKQGPVPLVCVTFA